MPHTTLVGECVAKGSSCCSVMSYADGTTIVPKKALVGLCSKAVPRDPDAVPHADGAAIVGTIGTPFDNAAVTISGIELAEKIKKGQYKTGKLGGRKATMPELWNAALAA